MSGKVQPHRIIPSGIPFAQIPHALNMDGDVTSAAYRVYGFLMKLANTEGRAWPGHRYVSKHVPLSRNTVARAIRNLEATGWVTINRDQQAHTYVVHGSLDRLDLDYGDRRSFVAGAETEPVPNVSRTGAETEPEPVQKLRQTETQDRQPITDTQVARRRDLLWESFVAVHGEPASKGERGKYNAAVGKLRDADVTPEEYPALVLAFTTKHNGLQPAVATVANRVGELRHFVARGPVQGKSLEDVADEQRWAALADTEGVALP